MLQNFLLVVVYRLLLYQDFHQFFPVYTGFYQARASSFNKGLNDLIPGLKSLIISAPAEFRSKS